MSEISKEGKRRIYDLARPGRQAHPQRSPALCQLNKHKRTLKPKRVFLLKLCTGAGRTEGIVNTCEAVKSTRRLNTFRHTVGQTSPDTLQTRHEWGSIAQSFCKALRAARSTVPCGKAYIFSNLLEGLLDTFKVSRSCDFHHHILFVICALLNSGLSAAEAETSGKKRAAPDTRDSRKRKKKKSREYRRGDVSVSLALVCWPVQDGMWSAQLYMVKCGGGSFHLQLLCYCPSGKTNNLVRACVCVCVFMPALNPDNGGSSCDMRPCDAGVSLNCLLARSPHFLNVAVPPEIAQP
ncbi:unnamed protein product [Leuciscus chuanchicus]